MENFLEIGKIVNTHGLRGELKVDPWCDPNDVLSAIDEVYLDGQAVSIVSWRMHKQFVLLTLKGIDSIEKAEALKTRVLHARRDDIELDGESFFYSDLFGFAVYDERVDRQIGVLRDVRELPRGELYVIEQDGREILVPAVEEFERGVDFEERVIRLHTIEGMLPDEN